MARTESPLIEVRLYAYRYGGKGRTFYAVGVSASQTGGMMYSLAQDLRTKREAMKLVSAAQKALPKRFASAMACEARNKIREAMGLTPTA